MEKFQELGLNGEILKGVADLGFVTPSPVQEKAIPVILGEQNDLVVLEYNMDLKNAIAVYKIK